MPLCESGGMEINMRILHEKDREELLGYVKREPEMNLFLIGDLENYGIESETVNVYLHEERDRWDFVILRFYQYFLLYSQYEDYNVEEAIAFLCKQKPDCISGKTALLRRIAPAFPQWAIDSTYMSRCDHVEGAGRLPDNTQADTSNNMSAANDLIIRRLEDGDVPEAIDMLTDIEEFARTYKKDERDEQIKRMKDEMAQGSKVTVGGFLNGRLVAVASTSAENSESAMVVGVATVKEHRGKGYASAVMTALCQDCFERGKKFICLFYDNPVAGRIYNRIGFREIGEYGMLR